MMMISNSVILPIKISQLYCRTIVWCDLNNPGSPKNCYRSNLLFFMVLEQLHSRHKQFEHAA